MTTVSLYEGAVAPEQYTLVLKQAAGFDYSTVTAAEFVVRKPDGSRTTWTASISAQTTTSLSLTHVFAPGEAIAGDFRLYARLTVPTGSVRSRTRTLRIKPEFDET